MSITISKNRSNWWTFVGLLMTTLLATIAVLWLNSNWPPELSFEWIVAPPIALISILGSLNFAYWLIRPREMSIEISQDYIRINDQPFIR